MLTKKSFYPFDFIADLGVESQIKQHVIPKYSVDQA